jgi:uncharacterized protein (DUF305 family)
MTHILRTLALPTALVATMAVASCGTSPSTPAASSTPSATAPSPSGTQSPVGPPATGESNVGDIEFATAMITWHLQSEAMGNLASKHAIDGKIKALAPKMKKPQGPEVTRMAGWLVGGGLPVPDITGGTAMAGMAGMAGMGGKGGRPHVMMSAQEMTALAKATGSRFDRMWLQLMVKHHQGAVATARTELAKGINVDAKKIAQTVIDRQTAEIAKLKSILSGISG